MSTGAPSASPRARSSRSEPLGSRALSPYEGVRSALGSPRAAAERAAETVQGLLTMSGILRPPIASSLNGPIGPHRRWDWARSRLSDVKRIRNAFGGTVNDVVLTAIAGGFRELLASRGERTDRAVRSLVPVSVRSARGTGRVQQPGFGDLRGSAAGNRGSGRAALLGAPADGAIEALPRSRGG